MIDVPHHTAPPAPLKSARVLLWIQFAFVVFATLTLVATVIGRAEHGQDTGVFVILAVLNAAMAVGLLLGAAYLPSRRSWVRPLVFTLEGVNVVNALVNIVTVSLLSVIGLLLAGAVILLLLDRRVKEWAAA